MLRKMLELLIIACDDLNFLLFMEAQNLIPDKLDFVEKIYTGIT